MPLHSQWHPNRCFSGIPLISLWSSGCCNLISSSSAFSKPSLYIWKFFSHYWSQAWRILRITLECVKWVQLYSSLNILWNSAFRCLYLSFSPLLFASLLFTAICKASSDSHFAFLYFFFFGMVLIPVSCTVLQTSVHSCSGILSTRSSPLNLFVTSNV